MTLDELKQLLGIPLDDTTDDFRLGLLLEAGIVAAQKYCDKIDFLQYIVPETGKLDLPAAVKLGIGEWARVSDELEGLSAGVQSHSIAGMSKTFGAIDQVNHFISAHNHWAPYHSAVKFYRF